MSTSGSDFDTILAVYTGTSLNQLLPVTYNDNAGDQYSRVTFPVTEGATCQVVVGDASFYSYGMVSLNIALQ